MASAWPDGAGYAAWSSRTGLGLLVPASAPSPDGTSCLEDSVRKCRQRAPESKNGHPRKAGRDLQSAHSSGLCPGFAQRRLLMIAPVCNERGPLSAGSVLGPRTCSVSRSLALLTSSYKETLPHCHLSLSDVKSRATARRRASACGDAVGCDCCLSWGVTVPRGGAECKDTNGDHLVWCQAPSDMVSHSVLLMSSQGQFYFLLLTRRGGQVIH